MKTPNHIQHPKVHGAFNLGIDVLLSFFAKLFVILNGNVVFLKKLVLFSISENISRKIGHERDHLEQNGSLPLRLQHDQNRI